MEVGIYEKLIMEFKAGNKNAIGNIYKLTVRKVYAYVYSRVGNKNWCEDIVSETYLALFNILDRYDGSSKIETFIIGIANNKIKQYFSKLNEQHSLTDDEEEQLIINDDDLEEDDEKKKILKNKLNEVLGQLPDKDKEVLVKRFVENKNIKETAETLKISEANVRVIQHRALKKAVEIANQIINK